MRHIAFLTIVVSMAGGAACTNNSAVSISDVTLQALAVWLLPAGNDPKAVWVAVEWNESGWCVGQFRESTKETTTTVVFGPVISHLDPNLACAGVGTANNTAFAELTLREPLGDRTPVRGSDQAVLPVRQMT